MVVTELKSVETEFLWSLENFSTHVNYNESFALGHGLKLLIEIRSNYNKNDRNYVQPFLRLEGHEGVELVEVSIKHVRGYSFYVFDLIELTGDEFLTEDEDPFLSQDHLDIFLKNGCMDLIVTIAVKRKVSPETLGANVVDQKEKLFKDLKAILDSKAVSDFTYRVDGRDFPVHKMILAARSPVYLKMFSTDYKISTEGIIDNTTAEAFEEFIRFIYTGEVKDLLTHAKDLLKIADKYEVDDLKTICELHLLSNLTEDVAAELFLTAHEFKCSVDLKKASFEFIKSSFAKLNLALHDDFIRAPDAVCKLIMMRSNMEEGLKIGNVQAELDRKATNTRIGEPEKKTESLNLVPLWDF